MGWAAAERWRAGVNGQVRVALGGTGGQMKPRFLNLKLGKRLTRKGLLTKAKIAADRAGGGRPRESGKGRQFGGSKG